MNIARCWSNFKKASCYVLCCCQKKNFKVRSKYDLLMRKGVSKVEKDLDMIKIVKNVRYLMTIAKG